MPFIQLFENLPENQNKKIYYQFHNRNTVPLLFRNIAPAGNYGTTNGYQFSVNNDGDIRVFWEETEKNGYFHIPVRTIRGPPYTGLESRGRPSIERYYTGYVPFSTCIDISIPFIHQVPIAQRNSDLMPPKWTHTSTTKLPKENVNYVKSQIGLQDYYSSSTKWLRKICQRLTKLRWSSRDVGINDFRVETVATTGSLEYPELWTQTFFIISDHYNISNGIIIRLHNNYQTLTQNVNDQQTLIGTTNISDPKKIKVNYPQISTVAEYSKPFESDIPITTEIEKNVQPTLLTEVKVIDPNFDFQKLKYAKSFFSRTFLWGSTIAPNVFVISDLDNPYYFPEYNFYKISKNSKEIIQNMVFFNNVIVAFSNYGIYMIKKIEDNTGTTLGFQVKQLNIGLGTKFPKSLQVIGNYIYFIGTDYRVYILKSLYNITEDARTNVELIDIKIANMLNDVFQKTNPQKLFTVSHKLEYQIFIDKYRFRYYTEKQRRVWTYDESAFFQEVYGGFSENGILNLYHADGIFSDEVESYLDNEQPIDMELVTPKYDLQYPHHLKSYKKILVQLGDTPSQVPVELFVNVKVDDQTIRSYITKNFEVDLNNYFILTEQENPNLIFSDFSGKIGSPILTEDDHWQTSANLTAKQKKVRTSARGYTYQFMVKYRQNKLINLKSLGIETRLRRAK